MKSLSSSKTTYQITALKFDKLTYQQLVNEYQTIQYHYKEIQLLLQHLYKISLQIIIDKTQETQQFVQEMTQLLDRLNQYYLSSLSSLHGYYVNQPEKTKTTPIRYYQSQPSRPFTFYLYPISTKLIQGVKHYEYRYVYTIYDPFTSRQLLNKTGTFLVTSVQKTVTCHPLFLTLEFTTPVYQINDLFLITNQHPKYFTFQVSNTSQSIILLNLCQDSLQITSNQLSNLTCQSLQTIQTSIKQGLSRLEQELFHIQSELSHTKSQQTNTETLLTNYRSNI